MKKVILLSIVISFSHFSLAENANDLEKTLQEAKPSYNLNKHKTALESSKKRQTSKFDQLKLQPHDTIKSINGQKVNSPSKALKAFSSLKAGDKVIVERDGKMLEFVYRAY